MTPMPDTQGKFPTTASGQTRSLEREVKFDAPLGLALPDLRDLVGRTGVTAVHARAFQGIVAALA